MYGKKFGCILLLLEQELFEFDPRCVCDSINLAWLCSRRRALTCLVVHNHRQSSEVSRASGTIYQKRNEWVQKKQSASFTWLSDWCGSQFWSTRLLPSLTRNLYPKSVSWFTGEYHETEQKFSGKHIQFPWRRLGGIQSFGVSFFIGSPPLPDACSSCMADCR